MGLLDDVRSSCAAIAASARSVRIDSERFRDVRPGPPPALDPETHYLEGSRDDVIAYLVTLDAINFGSGWFPRCESAGGAPATSRWRGAWPTVSASTGRGRTPSCARSTGRPWRRCSARSPITS